MKPVSNWNVPQCTSKPTSCPCSKFQGLSNSQLREMNIKFRLVDTFSAEIAMHRLHGNPLVVDLRIWTDKESICFSRDSLEQGWASTKNSMSELNPNSAIVQISYLPGRPSTTSISPLRTSPSKFLKIWIFLCCRLPMIRLNKLGASNG